MSYDISLHVPACNHCGRPEETIDVADPTYNLAPLWQEAFGHQQGIRLLDQCLAGKCPPMLKRAIEQMLADPDRYRKLEPDNGWGDYNGAVDTLQRLLTKCQRYPTATVMVR